MSKEKKVEVIDESVKSVEKTEFTEGTQPETPQAVTINNVPPYPWKRNEYGLLEHVNYIFNEDGSVNWRKMIKPEFLVPKKGIEETDVSKLEDKQLLILLGGIKDLARKRGYSYVCHDSLYVVPGYVALKTSIQWVGNYETDNAEVTFSSCADAHKGNTTGFTQEHLAAMAENRAFCRCVRNFLNINIVSREEISDETPAIETNNGVQPRNILAGLLKNNNISFENLKNRLIKEEIENSENWESIKDIPTDQIFQIMDVVQRRLDEKKKKKEEEAKS